ncbi:SAM-dependent methyltransferase, partial [Acinetobacter sp. ANC 4177]
KWNETQIKVSEILELTDQKPVFGHISGKRANTHWITFMKMEPADD